MLRSIRLHLHLQLVSFPRQEKDGQFVRLVPIIMICLRPVSRSLSELIMPNVSDHGDLDLKIQSGFSSWASELTSGPAGERLALAQAGRQSGQSNLQPGVFESPADTSCNMAAANYQDASMS